MSDSTAVVVASATRDLLSQENGSITERSQKWKLFLEITEHYRGLISSLKDEVRKKLFPAGRLDNITRTVNARADSFTNEQRELLGRLTAHRVDALHATRSANDLVRRIERIANDVLRIMNRSRENRYLEAALRRFQNELESVLPDINKVIEQLSAFSDNATTAEDAANSLKTQVETSLREFKMMRSSDCMKARGKAYSAATGVTASK